MNFNSRHDCFNLDKWWLPSCTAALLTDRGTIFSHFSATSLLLYNHTANPLKGFHKGPSWNSASRQTNSH